MFLASIQADVMILYIKTEVHHAAQIIIIGESNLLQTETNTSKAFTLSNSGQTF